MRILTVDNNTFLLSKMPDQITEDISFSVLDNSNPKDPDFFFMPLIFIESFSSPAIVLEIGGHEISMPLDWSVAVGDSESGYDLQIIPLTSLSDRGFEAFSLNPLSGFRPEFLSINVINFYNDVKWYFPKVKNNQLITTPLTDLPKSNCVFFIKDVSRQCESIDHSLLY